MKTSVSLELSHGGRLRRRFAIAAVLGSLATFGCSGGSSTAPGGASAGTGNAVGGNASGGAGNVSGGSGSANPNGGSVGISTGGSVTGGGTASGGAGNSNSMAGAATGGTANGGAATGGATAGGASSGGAANGGSGGALVYPTPLTTHLTIGAHDPSMIQVASKYYLFVTGGLLNVRSSTNFTQWANSGNIFSSMPAWIASELGTTITDLWAPDISYTNGVYRVYYAGSVFGANHSVIGLATNTTLDPSAAGYKWVDQGLVIESNKTAGADDWNAIDPNLTTDDSGQEWLVFGSFWSGIKLRQIDATTGLLSTSNTTLYALADNSSIEASSIVSHNGYYYLFVSYGACCKGVNSTYSTMVGRASAITGPYTNRAGAAMSKGNAETMLTTDGRYIGPGGGTAFRDGNLYYYVYHYYDGDANGNPYLMMRPIQWTADDWPMFGDPLWQ
jgi:arabinan endo-1,5-alpha-L-arabinosidase